MTTTRHDPSVPLRARSIAGPGEPPPGTPPGRSRPAGGRPVRHRTDGRPRTLRQRLGVAALAVVGAALAVLATAAPASAHVVPSTVIALDVQADHVTARLTLPTADLITASGVEVPTSGAVPAQTAQEITDYLQQHFTVSTGTGPEADLWTVEVGDVALTRTEQWGTGGFPAVTATATLTPEAAEDVRTFTLDFDAIVHQVVTADVFVLLTGDATGDATGDVEVSGGSANRSGQAREQAAQFERSGDSGGQVRTLGTIKTDTVTGTVPALTVDLDDSGAGQGFLGMLTVGISHIAEGTDHQLFLLTLLLPAPLLASAAAAGAAAGTGRRWREVARPGHAVRRITTITLAFTVGHSLTLALGAVGLPVPQQPVEALIAVSILVAAAHAVRPLFPGREAFVAGFFGLVHGMAFSTTLSELQLSGGQLAWSLLGFNVGIEIMQLVVVLLVLPPLIVLARTPIYPPLRVGAAAVTALAATGWLIDRIGYPTPLGAAADNLGAASPWIVAALWIAAAVVAARFLTRRTRPAQDAQVSVLDTPSKSGTG
ncbi:HupE/UreJ family protein [Kineococcus sp. SYSU DK003]|uniref:HupE/UreJ family protein n=1 Tax=Kineococcus sp. SYSU DK003 TaxID=3383124 RepID=UPI003D7D9771